jgi:transcriptional regulator with XRE-family HTH domain
MTRLQFRRIIKQLDLSQQAAADLVGVNISTAQRWARYGTDGATAILFRLLAQGKLTLGDVRAARDQ